VTPASLPRRRSACDTVAVEKKPDDRPDPTEPADPTAAAFGDGLPDPINPGTDEDDRLPIDKMIEDLQGPDIENPDHTFLPE
jgi:hypothetical protein